MTRLNVVVAAFVFALIAAGPAPARKTWDHGAMTPVANELATASRALKRTLHAEPRIAEAARAGTVDGLRLLESLDRLGNATRELARALNDLRGYEYTLSMVTDARTRVGEIEEYGADVTSAAWIEEQLAPVRELLDELASYYSD